MRFLLGRWAWRRLGANLVSGYRVCRSRIAVVRIPLDEGVIDECSRPLQRFCLGSITSDRLTTDRPQQIADLRITDVGFWHTDPDRAIRYITSLCGPIAGY